MDFNLTLDKGKFVGTDAAFETEVSNFKNHDFNDLKDLVDSKVSIRAMNISGDKAYLYLAKGTTFTKPKGGLGDPTMEYICSYAKKKNLRAGQHFFVTHTHLAIMAVRHGLTAKKARVQSCSEEDEDLSITQLAARIRTKKRQVSPSSPAATSPPAPAGGQAAALPPAPLQPPALAAAAPADDQAPAAATSIPGASAASVQASAPAPAALPAEQTCRPVPGVNFFFDFFIEHAMVDPTGLRAETMGKQVNPPPLCHLSETNRCYEKHVAPRKSSNEARVHNLSAKPKALTYDPICKKFFHVSCHVFYHSVKLFNGCVPSSHALELDFQCRDKYTGEITTDCDCNAKYNDPKRLCRPKSSTRGRPPVIPLPCNLEFNGVKCMAEGKWWYHVALAEHRDLRCDRHKLEGMIPWL